MNEKDSILGDKRGYPQSISPRLPCSAKGLRAGRPWLWITQVMA